MKTKGFRLAALLAIAMAVLFATILLPSSRQSRTSGDAAGPRLVGFRPDYSDTIYDSSGRELRDEFFAGVVYGIPSNMLVREFIFEFGPQSGAVLPPQSGGRWNFKFDERGYYKSRYSGMSYALGNGDTRVTVQANVPEFYLSRVRLPQWLNRFSSSQRLNWLLLRKHRVDYVEVTAEYLPAKEAKFDARVEGPFRLGSPINVQSNLTLTPVRASPLHLSASQGYGQASDWLVFYDRAGRRHFGQARGAHGGFYGFVVPDLSLDELAAIVIEQPRTKTFHHVRLPDLPRRSQPEFVETISAKVGWPSTTLIAQRNKLSSEQMLSVLSDLRGSDFLQTFWQATRPARDQYDGSGFGESHLSDESRQQLRRAVETWSASYNPTVRMVGCATGIACGWDEFIGPGLALTTNQVGYFPSFIPEVLQRRARRLSEDQITAVEEVIRSAPAAYLVGTLYNCLRVNGSAAAEASLLRLAQDERPWVWDKAMKMLSQSTVTNGTTPAVIRERAVLTRRATLGQFPEVRNALRSDALAMLKWELFERAPSLISDMPFHLQSVPPENLGSATDIAMKFIRDWTTYGRNESHYAATEAIRLINSWHGTDFGGVGTNMSSALPGLDGATNAAAQALECWQKQQTENRRL